MRRASSDPTAAASWPARAGSAGLHPDDGRGRPAISRCTTSRRSIARRSRPSALPDARPRSLGERAGRARTARARSRSSRAAPRSARARSRRSAPRPPPPGARATSSIGGDRRRDRGDHRAASATRRRAPRAPAPRARAPGPSRDRPARGGARVSSAPARSRTIRPACSARRRSWVTITIVWPLAVQLAKQLHHLVGGRRIEVPGRLVREEHARARSRAPARCLRAGARPRRAARDGGGAARTARVGRGSRSAASLAFAAGAAGEQGRQRPRSRGR